MKDALGSAATTVQRTASDATHSTGEFFGSVGSSAKNAGGELTEYVQKNPLSAAIWAVGIGALVAFLLPDTDAENRILGPTRDSLIDTAQQSAGQLLDKVQNVSSKAFEVVSDAAKDAGQGVMEAAKDAAHNVVNVAQDAAKNVTEVAKEEAKTQGLTA